MRDQMKTTFMALTLSALSINAFAHAPFIAPSNYVVSGDNTSILAGFAEHPFDSEVAIRGFDFKVTTPKGETKTLTLSNTSSLSSANVESTVDGTYQIVGQRTAPIQYVKVGERWLRVLDAKGASVPPLEARSFILPAEITEQHEKFDVKRVDHLISYFTKHKQTAIQPLTAQNGLTLNYSVHPNLIKVGDVLKLTVQLNQKAVAGYQVQVERQKTSLLAQDTPLKLTTNAQGQVEIPFKLTGQYIVTVSSPEQQENKKPEAETYRSFLSIYVN